MSTVVRPTEADLIAIARRINGPLSPEGAESWYRIDSATLLEEVRTLRHEAEAARHSFLNDGVQCEPDASLYEWAKAWKASATGFWEKTQTKNLRTRIVELTRTIEDLQATLEKQREDHERNVELLNARHTDQMTNAKSVLARVMDLL